MEIKIAEKAGFCFGVDRAVKIAYECPDKYEGRKIYTYGMLIHNRDVNETLTQKGIICAESIDEIPCGSVAIVRAHGITSDEYSLMAQKDIEIVDATCPYVKRIHTIVKREF